MATVMYRDEWNSDNLVLGHSIEDRKVSAKSVTTLAMALSKIEVDLFTENGS